MTELIICEKPAQAKKIAESLADGKPKTVKQNGVPYYELKHNKKEIIVGCAVGHLFTLTEKEKKGWTYPTFNLEWKPAADVRKSSAFSKKYLNVLKKLAKKAKIFTVACDYDQEGSTIGYNCIKHICKKNDAKRMKFSTLTKDELVKSYENASPHLDFPLIESGLTRHTLDYFYGINLSRALTLAVKTAGTFKILSAGRVQGPALKLIYDKEQEIKNFKPEPYWEIELTGKVSNSKISAWHKEGKLFDKKKAQTITKNTKSKDAIVASLKKRETTLQAPFPFDLTTLQTESYRAFGISPKETLAIAQDLYLNGLISYPRTSSQKLPASLGLKPIIKKLSKQPKYKEICNELLKTSLKPNEGKKSDPAHPAIFATGETPKLDGRKAKVYDLIARRFLATFSQPVVRESITAEIDCNKEIFLAKGMRTLEQGWHKIYTFADLKEQQLPAMKQGAKVSSPKIAMHEDKTKPPKRFTPASIIKELEKRSLGTKATRADIVENLYQRHYLKEKSIEATGLGESIVEVLEKYCPEILDEKLTRHFEQEMEQIMEKTKKREDVLKEAKQLLTKLLAHFKKNEEKIGKGLLKATHETRHELSKVTSCPNCKKGELVIRKGKFGNFLACNAYPKCKTTSSLPTGLIKPSDKTCPECKSITVTVIRSGKRPFNYCINKKCKLKEEWKKKMEALKEKEPSKKE